MIFGLKHQNEKFFSYIKAIKQKEIKAPIIYITVHIKSMCTLTMMTVLFIALLQEETDLGSITFKCNRLHYNYFAIFMITLHYDFGFSPLSIIFQLYGGTYKKKRKLYQYIK
jgi:hypothetical protein